MSLNLYDGDYYQWLNVTATLLNEGRLNDLDVPNLLDELEAMGKSQKRAIESHLKVLLLWQGDNVGYNPDIESSIALIDHKIWVASSFYPLQDNEYC